MGGLHLERKKGTGVPEENLMKPGPGGDPNGTAAIKMAGETAVETETTIGGLGGEIKTMTDAETEEIITEVAAETDFIEMTDDSGETILLIDVEVRTGGKTRMTKTFHQSTPMTSSGQTFRKIGLYLLVDN